jgi:hypothetical protein
MAQKLCTTLVVLLTMGWLGAAFSEAADSPETLREQQLAFEAERSPEAPGPVSLVPGGAGALGGASALLFVAVDDSNVPAYVIDPTDNTTTPGFTGVQVWGAALIPGASAGDGVVYFNNGSALWRWPANGVPELCCTLTYQTAAQAMVSVAYDPAAGEILFTKNISVEAVYSLPVVAANCPPSCEVTQELVYSSTLDLGGLSFDPATSTLYATNDSSAQVVIINGDGSTTPVTSYPAGQTDIDGLAFGDGRLYLVIDEPGSIFVYDLASASYVAPLTNPWTTFETFSAGAFGTGLIPVELQGFVVE